MEDQMEAKRVLSLWRPGTSETERKQWGIKLEALHIFGSTLVPRAWEYRCTWKAQHSLEIANQFPQACDSCFNHTIFFSFYLKIFKNFILKESKVKVLIAQSRLTLCNPMDCSPSGSSLYGILQARILEWVAISFSKGSSWPRNRTWVSCTAGRFSIIRATREAQFYIGVLLLSCSVMSGSLRP